MVSPVHVVVKIVMQKVGKEKQLNDAEQDKELYQDNGP